MNTIIRQTQLYNFLDFCNKGSLTKKVLDCGAGGDCPPLAIFHNYGYEVYGIELSEDQINKSENFAKDNGLNLNISKGNMLQMPFENGSFSYVYSYNTIFHMTKRDVFEAVKEIKRVLTPGGLCFVNFLSINDYRHGEGEKVSEGEFLQKERDDTVIHSYFLDEEPNDFFDDMQIIFKEKRIVERFNTRGSIKRGFIDYICRK